MIKITNVDVYGWESALRGMRNPMNSWEKSDSEFDEWDKDDFIIGENDKELAMKLIAGGPVHAKFRRMITVTCDILAPLYWWKEFDTYKVGTVANSCSTMHTIHKDEFDLDDFSHEHLHDDELALLEEIIKVLNGARELFLAPDGTKEDWWKMIQLLPTSFNQLRTIKMNYEVLAAIYESRRYHKLDEWRKFCEMIERLPYSEFITGEKK